MLIKAECSFSSICRSSSLTFVSSVPLRFLAAAWLCANAWLRSDSRSAECAWQSWVSLGQRIITMNHVESKINCWRFLKKQYIHAYIHTLHGEQHRLHCKNEKRWSGLAGFRLHVLSHTSQWQVVSDVGGALVASDEPCAISGATCHLPLRKSQQTLGLVCISRSPNIGSKTCSGHETKDHQSPQTQMGPSNQSMWMRERERKRSKKRVLATESSIVNHFPNVTFCQKSLWKLSRSVKAAHLARQQTVRPSGQSGHAESNLWRRHQVKQTSSES